MEICEVGSVDADDVEAGHIEVDEDDSDSDSDNGSDSSGDNGDEGGNESDTDTDTDSEGNDDESSDGNEEGDADEADVRGDLSSLENILGGRHAELLASAGLSIGGLARFNSTNQFRPLLAALK
ncbi:hypothetical protein GGI18_005923, partial [Coemansia linderi]